MQEEVLNFIYNAYHNHTGKLSVPRSLKMEKDMSDRREIAQLKTYRTIRGYALDSLAIVFTRFGIFNHILMNGSI